MTSPCANAANVGQPVLSFPLPPRKEERRLNDAGDSCQHVQDRDKLCEFSMRKWPQMFAYQSFFCHIASEKERRLDGTGLIPPSIERILNVHAQMLQQFA